MTFYGQLPATCPVTTTKKWSAFGSRGGERFAQREAQLAIRLGCTGWLRALSLVLLCSVGLSQSMTTVGRFTDSAGRPVAGGTVAFATSPEGIHGSFNAVSVVTAQTNDDGRFRVRLVSGLVYSSWALGPRTAVGCVRTVVTEGVRAGAVVEFQGSTNSDLKVLRIEHLDRLKPERPVAALVSFSARHSPELRLRIEDDAVIGLPPLPDAASLFVKLVSEDGRICYASRFGRNGSLTVRETALFKFRVFGDDGRPVAGATVYQLQTIVGEGLAQRTFDLQLLDAHVASRPTDRDGRVDLVGDSRRRLFIAQAPGFPEVVSGRNGRRWIESDVDVASGHGREWPDELEFVLRKGPVHRLKLLRNGRPAASCGLRLTTEMRFRTGDFVWSRNFAKNVIANSEGEVVFTMPRTSKHISVAVQPEHASAPRILMLPRKHASDESLDLECELADLARVRFRVFDHHKAPPRKGLLVVMACDAEFVDPKPRVLVTDRGGRAVADFEAGRWLIFATDRGCGCALLLDLRGGRDKDVDMNMSPLPMMTGRVVKSNGDPAAGSTFALDGYVSTVDLAKLGDSDRALYDHALRIHHLLSAGVTVGDGGEYSIPALSFSGYTVLGSVLSEDSMSEVRLHIGDNGVIRLP